MKIRSIYLPNWVFVVATILMLTKSFCSQAWADDGLREKSQNPIGSLISVPFQNTTNFGVGALQPLQSCGMKSNPMGRILS